MDERPESAHLAVQPSRIEWQLLPKAVIRGGVNFLMSTITSDTVCYQLAPAGHAVFDNGLLSGPNPSLSSLLSRNYREPLLTVALLPFNM